MNAEGRAPQTPDTADPTHELLVLTKDDCHFCDLAKQVVQDLATEFQVSTALLPLDSAEGMALAERSGVLFPPGVFLDETLLSHGRPSYRRLRREVEARGVPARSRGLN